MIKSKFEVAREMLEAAATELQRLDTEHETRALQAQRTIDEAHREAKRIVAEARDEARRLNDETNKIRGMFVGFGGAA